MHRDHQFGSEIGEGSHGFFRVHVDVPAARGIVGADRHEGDVDVVPPADFRKALEIRAVPTMKDTLAAGADDVAAVVAVGVVEKTCAPVVGRGVDDFQQVEPEFVPNPHLMGGGEAEALDQGLAAHRHHDALASLQYAQAGLVQVVEMGVGHQHQIDFRQAVQVESGMSLAFHRAMPFRPVGINDHRVSGELQEKRGVPDPGNAHLFGSRRLQHRLQHVALPLAEHPGHDPVAQKQIIARGPALLGQDS